MNTRGLPGRAPMGYTPLFADMDGDRYPELLWAGDYFTSRYLRNDGGGGFTDITEQSRTGRLRSRRFKIISDFTDLGSGFKVALKDLEVRGAGNLLGGEQSGDILAVGYDLYVRLLDQEIALLEGNGGGRGLELEVPDVYLELEYSGYIPDDYIPEPVVKMEVYKKISAVTTAAELEQIHGELTDRFGPLPEVVLSLLSIAEIRIACRRLAIASLREQRGVVRVEFARMQQVSVDKVMRLLAESQGSVRLDPQRPNCLLIDTGTIGLREKSEFLSERLGSLV